MSHKSRTSYTHNGHRAKSSAASTDQLRQQIAAMAARIMAEEGVSDFHIAKRKAAERVGAPETKHLPGNEEVQLALQEYLRLFHADRLSQNVARWRQLALDAMQFLAKFEPRLVGAVLSGSVTPATAIELHITADSAEEIGLWLEDQGIPYEQGDRRLRFGGDRHASFPAYRFMADGVPVELCVMTHSEARELPLSPVDGKPMKRANRREVENIVNGSKSSPKQSTP